MTSGMTSGALSPGGPPANEPVLVGGVEVEVSPGDLDGASGGRLNQFALVYWQ